MDLTFVEVYDKYGLDVPVDSMASAFAYASYKLWHANQAARYNILNGMKAPESGHWKNNPHADDLDFQIEADFAGLMSPGMPNSAAEVCDGIGHIMTYGNGWYGGVYVAAMYALAFVSDDIEYIVTEALKTIPAESTYHQCVSDAIRWSKENADWKTTWKLIEEKWCDEITCPKGVKDPFNIEASVNSAYVVMGLLYGAGDMDRTLEVSTRCGADSDCNPATAAGILGTMLGYSNIPEKWMKPLREVEEIDFAHTDISLDRAYEMSFGQALRIDRAGRRQSRCRRRGHPCADPAAGAFRAEFRGPSSGLQEDRHLSQLQEAVRPRIQRIGCRVYGARACQEGDERLCRPSRSRDRQAEGDRGDACRFRAAPFRHLLELRTSRRRPYDEDSLAQSGGTRQRRHGRDIGLCA